MDNLNIVVTMLYLLCGRKGFDSWWFNIDLEIRRDMIKSFAQSLDGRPVIGTDYGLEYLLLEAPVSL